MATREETQSGAVALQEIDLVDLKAEVAGSFWADYLDMVLISPLSGQRKGRPPEGVDLNRVRFCFVVY